LATKSQVGVVWCIAYRDKERSWCLARFHYALHRGVVLNFSCCIISFSVDAETE
jgi:hypothetical protein